MAVVLTIKQSDIYDEVAKTTSYMGQKSDAEGAYEKVFTTDADQEMLKRFWDESKSALESLMKEFVSEATDSGDTYTYTLGMPTNWNGQVVEGLKKDVVSFMVASILGKWMKFIEREEAEGYTKDAGVLAEAITQKLYSRKKPTRTVIQTE